MVRTVKMRGCYIHRLERIKFGGLGHALVYTHESDFRIRMREAAETARDADSDIIGNGGASAAGINMMLTNQGHVQPVLCNNSAL